MPTTRLLVALTILWLLAIVAPSAQTPARPGQPLTNITLTTESDRVRFTTPGDALDWRLEVANAQGDSIFDSGMVASKELDWPLLDAQGQPIEGGLFSYTLTIGSDTANVRVQRGQLQIERVHSVYRIAALGHDVAGSGVALTVIEASQAPASGSEPPGAHGSSGQQPAPLVPAAEPFRRSLSTVSFAPVPLISGSGETNHMTKWTDGPSGVVGDTNVTEVNAAVVIGNGTFRGNLHIYGGATDDVFAGMGPNLITGPGFNYGYAGSSFGRSAGFFNVRPDASAVAPNPSLRFMTANVQRMIITNAGQIGFGTSTPVARLEVATESMNERGLAVTNYGANWPGHITGQSARGTMAAPTAVQSGDRLAFFGARGYTGSAFSLVSTAGFEMTASENWTDAATGTVLKIYTTANGTASAQEWMRINHDGTVGIGTAAALAEKLHVFGDIRVGASGTNGCLQRFDGAALAGVCVSDLRFKRDITPFPDLLDKLVKLRPVHYYWRSDEFPQRQFGTTQAYGLIAQEVEQVFPELVTSNEHGFKQVDYSKLPLLTVQAIKELKAENDALKQQLQQLAALQQRLAALEEKLTIAKKQ